MLKNVIKMAWRNIGRNKRRTALTITAIVFGVASVIFARSFIDGIIQNVTNDFIKTDLGHIKIAHPEFLRLERIMPKEYLIENASQWEKKSKDIKEIDFIQNRIKFNVMLNHGETNEPAVAVGIVPESLDTSLAMKNKIIQGDFFSEKPEHELIIGKKLAKELNLKVNDEILLITTDINFSTYALAFQVKGIFETGFSSLDKHLLYIPLHKAQEMLDCGDSVHEMLIFLHSPRDTIKVKEQLQNLRPQIDSQQAPAIVAWMDNEIIADMFPMMKSIWNKTMMIIMFIAALVILNTMLMAVMERYHEVGVLKAMGFKNREVIGMIMIEAFFIGTIGSLGGGLFGGILAGITEKTGINMIKMIGDAWENIDIPIPFFAEAVYPDLTLSIIIGSLLFGLVTALAAAIYPAFKAARMQPVDAFRCELKI